MTCRYLCFDTLQMLSKLSDHYDKIEIESISDGDKLLTLYKDGKVVKQIGGSMFSIMTKASKPFIDQWKKDQKEFRGRIESVFPSKSVKNFSWMVRDPSTKG